MSGEGGGWNIDASGFDASIDALIARVDLAAREGVGKAGELLAAQAKLSFGPAHGKGTPKTVMDKAQSVTGSLRRSIRPTGPPIAIGRGVYSIRVAPSMIYGRRIELGFKGADSLGRVYNQPPYPYFKPGYDKALPLFEPLFTSVWNTAIHG